MKRYNKYINYWEKRAIEETQKFYNPKKVKEEKKYIEEDYIPEIDRGEETVVSKSDLCDIAIEVEEDEKREKAEEEIQQTNAPKKRGRKKKNDDSSEPAKSEEN